MAQPAAMQFSGRQCAPTLVRASPIAGRPATLRRPVTCERAAQRVVRDWGLANAGCAGCARRHRPPGHAPFMRAHPLRCVHTQARAGAWLPQPWIQTRM